MSQVDDGSSPDCTHPKKPRACTNCARLKIRCRWAPGSEHSKSTDCVRCSRMGIQCWVPEPVPRKKRGKSSRVTELEKKIDGLVNLFQSQQQPGQNQLTTATTTATTSPNSEDPHLLPCSGLTIPGISEASSTDANPIVVSPNTQECDNTSVSEAGSAGAVFQLIPGFSITVEKAEECLTIYRTRMVPNFPFVPISPNTSARELHSQKRFLFWCIIQAVIPQTAVVQSGVDDWVRRHVAMHIIVNKEKKLVLLQGLLVYIAWGDVHLQMGINANTLLQLAIGLVMDMTMYTLAGPLSWMPKNMLADAWCILGRGKTFEQPKQTLEEQRAILGGYFIASSVPAALRRCSQIPYTTQIARCFRAVREEGDLPSDANLLALVRMQHLGDRIRAVFPSPDREEGEPIPIFREHLGAVLSALRKDIDALGSEEPCINEEQHLIWAHYQTLKVRLYEPCIGMRAVSASEAISLTEPYSRTEALWSCLQAAQTAMTALLAIPAESFAYIAFIAVSDIAYSLMASNRLLLEDNVRDWDVTMARQKLDLPEIARCMADRFEEADNVALIVGQKRRLFDDNSSRWGNYAYRAKWMRQWYLSKVAPRPQEPLAEESQPAPEGAVTEQNMSWLGGIAIDQSFWDILMLGGPGQMPLDTSMLIPEQPMLPLMADS
ncbi:hypothetical protein EsH8_IX_000377 [Colletotrichum jinshuiense]